MTTDDTKKTLTFSGWEVLLIAGLTLYASLMVGTLVGEYQAVTLGDRCVRECEHQHSDISSWNVDARVCVCDNGYVGKVRTHMQVLQQGRQP